MRTKALLIGILLLGTLGLSSCNKTEGCSDPMAINHNPNAEKANDNLCRYTTATFYASSSTFTGAEVSEIVLTLGQSGDTIGVINTFNLDYPVDCNTTGTVQYEFKTAKSEVWFAQYRLATGGVVTAQGDFEASSTVECLRIDVLP